MHIDWHCDDSECGKLWVHKPMSSAGLFGLLLMNVSKASFMALTNFSFFMKQTSMTWSTLSLKSNNSCTIVLSFSGLITIVLPKALNDECQDIEGKKIQIKTNQHELFQNCSSSQIACVPWCTLSSAAEGLEHRLAHDWTADRAETDLGFCSHPAGESTLGVSNSRKS